MSNALLTTSKGDNQICTDNHAGNEVPVVQATSPGQGNNIPDVGSNVTQSEEGE